MEENCVFCRIIRKELPARIIDETDDVIVFLSLEQHPLIVTKQHIANIYVLPKDLGAAVMGETIKLAKAVKRGLPCDGVYIAQANDPAGGQDVFHYHVHIYPRWERGGLDLESADDSLKDTLVRKIQEML